jgi:hypothetical protein
MLAHIKVQQLHLNAKLLPKITFEGLQSSSAACGEDEPCPSRRERIGTSFTNAATGTGNQNNAITDCWHKGSRVY